MRSSEFVIGYCECEECRSEKNFSAILHSIEAKGGYFGKEAMVSQRLPLMGGGGDGMSPKPPCCHSEKPGRRAVPSTGNRGKGQRWDHVQSVVGGYIRSAEVPKPSRVESFPTDRSVGHLANGGGRKFRNIKSPVAEYIRNPAKFYRFDAARKERNSSMNNRVSNSNSNRVNVSISSASKLAASRNSKCILEPDSSIPSRKMYLDSTVVNRLTNGGGRKFRNIKSPVAEYIRNPAKSRIGTAKRWIVVREDDGNLLMLNLLMQMFGLLIILHRIRSIPF